jgi:hypothetical protein
VGLRAAGEKAGRRRGLTGVEGGAGENHEALDHGEWKFEFEGECSSSYVYATSPYAYASWSYSELGGYVNEPSEGYANMEPSSAVSCSCKPLS